MYSEDILYQHQVMQLRFGNPAIKKNLCNWKWSYISDMDKNWDYNSSVESVSESLPSDKNSTALGDPIFYELEAFPAWAD